MELLINEEIDEIMKEKSKTIREMYSGKYFWKLHIKFLRLKSVVQSIEYVFTYPHRQMEPFIGGENLYNIIHLVLQGISRWGLVVFDRFQIYFSCQDIVDPDYNSEEIFICEIPVKNKNMPYGIFD